MTTHDAGAADDTPTLCTSEMSARRTPPVAVLGIGAMGHGMARSLLRSGIPTVVWDRRPARSEALAERGACVAATVRDAARSAGIAITMVTDADAVLSIADDQGLLAALPPRAILVQMSTIGVNGTEAVARRVADRRPDVTFVDAPVAGTRGPAQHGRLTIFASGPDDARSLLAPVFDALGHHTIWVGPAGLGTRLKLVNNTMLALTVEGIAEALALAHQFGLTTHAVVQALDNGPLASPFVSAKLQRIAEGDYSPEFSLALALKDVDLALAAADRAGLPATDQVATVWHRAVEQGRGEADVTVVARTLDGSPG